MRKEKQRTTQRAHNSARRSGGRSQSDEVHFMESTITIPLARYEALVKKETMLDIILLDCKDKPTYERDKVLAAAQKYFEEGLLEC